MSRLRWMLVAALIAGAPGAGAQTPAETGTEMRFRERVRRQIAADSCAPPVVGVPAVLAFRDSLGAACRIERAIFTIDDIVVFRGPIIERRAR